MQKIASLNLETEFFIVKETSTDGDAWFCGTWGTRSPSGLRNLLREFRLIQSSFEPNVACHVQLKKGI